MKTIKEKYVTTKCLELLGKAIEKQQSIIYVVDVKKVLVKEYIATKIIPKFKNNLVTKQIKDKLIFKNGATLFIVSQFDNERKEFLARNVTTKDIISDNAIDVFPLNIREEAFPDSNYIIVIDE